MENSWSYNHYEINQTNIIFKFEWPHIVDDKQMVLKNSYGGILDNCTYESYLFMNPITPIEKASTSAEIIPISYEIIAGMLAILALVIKLPNIVPYLRFTRYNIITRESLV